jgi:uncharacterized protein (DUF952 family)
MMEGVVNPTIFHIATTAAWNDAQRSGAYTADSLATEGYIHCSGPGQVVAVANRLFHGRSDLVLLQIDVARLDAPVRYENLEGGIEPFPHVYGPLPLSAVVRSAAFTPDATGAFSDGSLGDLLAEDGAADMTRDEHVLRQTAHTIAAAIARRDVALLGRLLAPDFAHRGDAAATTSDAGAFLDAIRNIPGEVAFVRLERVAVDVHGDAALVSGVQHARVVVDGQTVDDRRGFADLFVRIDETWKLRAGSDFPRA